MNPGKEETVAGGRQVGQVGARGGTGLQEGSEAGG